MLRLLAAGFALAIIFCGQLNAEDVQRPLPPQKIRMVVQCPKSKLMIDNPDSVWNETKFRCEDGQVRINGSPNQ
jgi:hypothetical protein